MNFTDRFLKCSDCGEDFVFTAGEQLFFFDKQFKNDPKRCKLCKAKRAGLGRTMGPNGAIALPLSRTETKTQCSSCGVETTVPFQANPGPPGTLPFVLSDEAGPHGHCRHARFAERKGRAAGPGA